MGYLQAQTHTHQQTTTRGNMNKTARELLGGQQVEWVRPDDLVDQALQKMAKHDLSQMREINDLKAGSLHMTEVNKLATVPADMVAFDAFMTMHKEGLSSLAVVSGNGEIFENISATDLKGALTDFKRLLLSVRDYLAVTRALVIGKKRAEGLVYCEREKSLVEVMNRINETRVHRLYVVDEQRKPVGVVSLTDIYHSLQRVMIA